MPEPDRHVLGSPAGTAPALSPELTARLTGFARACRAAARAVSLYPGTHPAIAATLRGLVAAGTELTAAGPLRLQVLGDRLLIDGAGPARPETAVSELAAILHRHLVGAVTVSPGAASDSWHTLLLLLARSPEDVRADGGISRLWAAAGGPSLDIEEVDYAEVLREKPGLERTIEDILAAAASLHQSADDLAPLLREVFGDPERVEALLAAVEQRAQADGVDAAVAILLNLLRCVAGQLMVDERTEDAMAQLGKAVHALSAETVLALVGARDGERGDEAALVDAFAGSVTGDAAASLVARSVDSASDASPALAQAFQALVPPADRPRVTELARARAAASAADADAFARLWERVEARLLSHHDPDFVPDAYARELDHARAQAVDVEQTSDDPPERVDAWLATVADQALRALDHALLADLLVIEPDHSRWRDIADTAVTHAEGLVRAGVCDPAWSLLETLVAQGRRDDRRPALAAVLARLAQVGTMRRAAVDLRTASQESSERFREVCLAVGPAVIAPLAEALAAEQDPRARRRLRDVLIGFGPEGRDSVQALMSAPGWEVRRTAAYLLRELGGADALRELRPLLDDPEPLVRREAVHGLVLSGTAEAASVLMAALLAAPADRRRALVTEIVAARDERAWPLFAHLVERLDRRRFPELYLESLAVLGGIRAPEAVPVLAAALRRADWWRPFLTRRHLTAAARSLGSIGTPAAMDALRQAARSGPLGARRAARAELKRFHP